MFNVTQREFRQDDSGCAHSNVDCPVGQSGNYEEFHCSKCGHLIARELDGCGKQTGKSFIVVAV